MSGCKSLDELLGGGFEQEVVTSFLEKQVAAKQICVFTCHKMFDQGKKVIIIDTEGILPEFKKIAGEQAKEYSADNYYEHHTFEERKQQ
jgi:RecA/RadA recombinase